MSAKTLLRGGCVLTLGARTSNLPVGDVLIEDDVIADVGPGLRARDAAVVDASDSIVMPGFVDAHRHVWKSLFRNDETMDVSALRPHLSPEDVYAATLAGLLGAAEAGTTTVVDWSDVGGEAAHRDAALQAHADSGLRTVLIHPPGTEVGGSGPSGTGVIGFVSDHDSLGSMRSLAVGASKLSAGSPDVARREIGLAREMGMRIHVHAGLDPSETGAVSRLRDVLGPDVTLIHGTNLGDQDLDAIAASGALLAVTPVSEMARSAGLPPVQRLMDRNIRLGLGVDDELIGAGDLFAQMRATISLQHAAYFDLKLAGKAGLPNLLTTREVIRFATIDSAHVAGVGAVAGSIEPGKQADIIVFRTDRPNIHPINDPIGAVVWGMDTSNLDFVFAGGRALMQSGVLTTNAAKARQLAVAAHDRVAESAGLLSRRAG